MGGRRPGVEQTGFGEHERARAHARHERAVVAKALQPTADRLVADLATRADPAGEDEDIHRGEVLPRVVGQDPESLGAGDDFTRPAEGEHGHVVLGPALGPGRQDLPRTRPVEFLRAVEHEDADRSHGDSLPCGHARRRARGHLLGRRRLALPCRGQRVPLLAH